MSEIPPTIEEVEIVEDISAPRAGDRSPSGQANPPDVFSRVEKIREELGILDGQVALTFVDDET